MRILIAEDNEVNLLVASRLLDKLGHLSVGVPDGQQALEALERGRFDLLILDLSMPVLDGLDTAKAIRARGLTIPIILLTAFTDAETRARAKDSGIDLFLDKPLDKEALRRAIDQIEASMAATHAVPPEADAAGDRLIDLALVRRRFYDDFTLLREIFGMYLEDAPARLKSIEAALTAGDSAAASKAAHSLKGISGSVGSQRLSDAALALERAGRAGDLAAARDSLPLIKELLAQTILEIREIIARLPA